MTKIITGFPMKIEFSSQKELEEFAYTVALGAQARYAQNRGNIADQAKPKEGTMEPRDTP